LNGGGITFDQCIKDAFSPENVIGAEKQETSTEKLVESSASTKESVVAPATNRCLYTISPHSVSIKDLLEITWIGDLLNTDYTKTFGRPGQIVMNEVKMVRLEDAPLTTKPIFIVQRPYVDFYAKLFEKYNVAGAEFYALHLSDEYGKDDISWYSLEACKNIVRNYVRPDVMSIEKALILPLGYTRRGHESINNQLKATPSPPFREIVWSFRGTRWMDREAKLAPLKDVRGDYSCVFYNEWKDPLQAGREEYVGEVLNSKFVACPGGMNAETFRFYEALELGAVPMYVRQEGDELYFKRLNETIPILSLNSWSEAKVTIDFFLSKPDIFEKYRDAVLTGWILTKERMSKSIKTFLGF
jgi:hypothetical protein